MENEKEVLRRTIKEQRALLDEADWKNSSRRIVDRYCELDCYQQADILMAYISFGKEVDLSHLFERCLTDGKRLAVPKVMSGVQEDARMEFIFLDADTVMRESDLHILEPEAGEMLDIASCQGQRVEMIMPGLCYDLCGGRIGYGGGYYDRYLERMQKIKIHKTVLAFDFQIMDRMPCGEQDITYDMLVTEKRYYII